MTFCALVDNSGNAALFKPVVHGLIRHPHLRVFALIGPRTFSAAVNFATALEQELKRLGLGRDLVRLNQAQAFVVNVSPVQLRALTESPLVGVIRPNRIHRMPLR